VGGALLPSKKEHSDIARQLARLFRVDPELASMGSMLPDVDVYPPLKHRKTLHNPVIAVLLARVDRSVALGYLSHIVADDLPLPTKLLHLFLKTGGKEAGRVLTCRGCGHPLTENDFVGASLEQDILVFVCPKCGRIQRVRRGAGKA